MKTRNFVLALFLSTPLLPATASAESPTLVTPENERRFQREAGGNPAQPSETKIDKGQSESRKTIYRRKSRENRIREK